jgi:hypothetical protein
MKASTATVDTLLQQACTRPCGVQAGVLAIQSVDILFQVCLPSSWLRLPVSPSVSTVS